MIKTLNSAKEYATALESRIDKMEKLLNKLLPGLDITEQLEGGADVEPLLPTAEKLPRNDEFPSILKKLILNPDDHRFFGKSSGIQLVQTALDFRFKVAGLPPPTCVILPNKRPEFWNPPQWLLPADEPATQFSFPDPDLLPILVDFYFKEVNCYFPVLHRPTFDRTLATGLHLSDPKFAATLLIVCSLGARFSDDPRVFLDNETVHRYHSAGWKWYNQIRVIPQNLIYKPDLYELQATALSALYLSALSPTVIGWSQIGFGLRRAQDVGAHRLRKQPHPTAENESWKRVFWVLLCLEWTSGTRSGRPIAMHEQDFDQALPIECDDEYWDLPKSRMFKQPRDKPSVISFFVSLAKLLEIQAAVTTNLYSPRRPRDLSGQPLPPIDSKTIVAFDSRLNAWLSQIPDHLRWDPERQNRLHFNQSAFLHTAYYNLQILLHRPFIPAPLQIALPDVQPSLTICTTAARSCCSVLEAQASRGGFINPFTMSSAFMAGLVLLLSVWSNSRSDFAKPRSSKDLELVSRLIDIMNAMETRYIGAGRYVDVLTRLLFAGERLEELLHDLNAAGSAVSERPLLPKPVNPLPAWASALVRAEDFECATDLHAPWQFRGHAAEIPADSAAQYLDGLYAFAPSVDSDNNNNNMHMDLSEFSQSMDIDLDHEIMAMWSTEPTGYHGVDDWGYIVDEDATTRPNWW